MIEREDARRARVRDRLRRMEDHRVTCHVCRVPNARKCNWMTKQVKRIEADGFRPGDDLAPIPMPPLTNPAPEDHDGPHTEARS